MLQISLNFSTSALEPLPDLFSFVFPLLDDASLSFPFPRALRRRLPSLGLRFPSSRFLFFSILFRLFVLLFPRRPIDPQLLPRSSLRRLARPSIPRWRQFFLHLLTPVSHSSALRSSRRFELIPRTLTVVGGGEIGERQREKGQLATAQKLGWEFSRQVFPFFPT